MTSPVVTLTSKRTFYINGVWCWLFLSVMKKKKKKKEKTNYIIKQSLTIEVLDITLISPLNPILTSAIASVNIGILWWISCHIQYLNS